MCTSTRRSRPLVPEAVLTDLVVTDAQHTPADGGLELSENRHGWGLTVLGRVRGRAVAVAWLGNQVVRAHYGL